jgi:glycosyltransferase involved in cell wall biosynthesis
LAETDEEYIDKVLKLVKDGKQCMELSRLSQEYIKRNFSWGKSEKILKRLYKKE